MGDGRNVALSRRDVIKRGAIAGGVLWAAPAVMKLAPAYGTHQGSPSCACPTAGQTLFSVQYTVDTTGSTLEETCAGAGDTPTCEPSCWDSATCDSFGIQSTSYSGGNAEIMLKHNAALIHDLASCPRTATVGTACVPGTPSTGPGGKTVLNYSGCEAGEVINIVYCI